eukprot:scaffold180367_cov59-Attheya_sp.AAC.1
MAIEKCGIRFRALRLLAASSEGRRRGKSFGFPAKSRECILGRAMRICAGYRSFLFLVNLVRESGKQKKDTTILQQFANCDRIQSSESQLVSSNNSDDSSLVSRKSLKAGGLAVGIGLIIEANVQESLTARGVAYSFECDSSRLVGEPLQPYERTRFFSLIGGTRIGAIAQISDGGCCTFVLLIFSLTCQGCLDIEIDPLVHEYPVLEEGQEEGDAFADEPEMAVRMVAPPYLDPLVEFPTLHKSVSFEHLAILQEEVKRIPQWTAWPETQQYSSSDDGESASWTVFPLCHTFPANDASQFKCISKTCSLVPEITELLKEFFMGDDDDGNGILLRTALFSRLDPETILRTHTGLADLSNHVMRIHIPFVGPVG